MDGATSCFHFNFIFDSAFILNLNLLYRLSIINCDTPDDLTIARRRRGPWYWRINRAETSKEEGVGKLLIKIYDEGTKDESEETECKLIKSQGAVRYPRDNM